MGKIKVLIVDDSAVVRKTLTGILESDPEIEVVGTAGDPYIAVAKMKTVIPDVISLDIQMPRMDGITFLKKLMSQHPIPVVICSSMVEEGAAATIAALEAGAVDIILKNKLGVKEFLKDNQVIICDSIKAASKAKIGKHPSLTVEKKLSADAMLAWRPSQGGTIAKTTDKIVVVGASTGGTEALRKYLEGQPPDIPGTVIVQHMPEGFTRSFAERLNELCRMEVKEAKDGDGVFTGRVLIAPGNKHTMVKRRGARYYVEVKKGPLVNRHRPSADVLFRSGARYAGPNAVGVIMTGMGSDGARGMLELRESGAYTIAQDENSCVVFGMPREAILLGGVAEVLPLEKISQSVLKICNPNYSGQRLKE